MGAVGNTSSSHSSGNQQSAILHLNTDQFETEHEKKSMTGKAYDTLLRGNGVRQVILLPATGVVDSPFYM